jgi:hypothetical protein
MAMPKKKTTVKKTAPKTEPKKKIGKNISDVTDYIKSGGRSTTVSVNPKTKTTTVHTPSMEGPYNLSTKVRKQGKSGFSSVSTRNATFTNQNKDYGKRGTMSPIANPRKAFTAIQEAARQDDIRNRRRNSVKKKGK